MKFRGRDYKRSLNRWLELPADQVISRQEAKGHLDRFRVLVREGKVRSVNGIDIAVRAETICVHSDTPNAVEVARAVRDAVAEINPSPACRGGN